MSDHKKFCAEIKQALADYMWAEGCSCCCDLDAHKKAENQLAKLLRIPKYDDGSGYDFFRYRSKADDE